MRGVLYPCHGRGLRNVAESCVEQRLDLCEVVGCAECCEISLADDCKVGFHLCVADNAVELLGDLVQLLEFLAEGMRLLLDGRVKHVHRGAVFARRSGGVAPRDVLQGPLLCEAFVRTLTVGQGSFRDRRDSWLLLDVLPKLLKVA